MGRKGGKSYDKLNNKNRHHGNDSDFTNYSNIVVGCEAESLSVLKH